MKYFMSIFESLVGVSGAYDATTNNDHFHPPMLQPMVVHQISNGQRVGEPSVLRLHKLLAGSIICP
jgi:hypothetical protein